MLTLSKHLSVGEIILKVSEFMRVFNRVLLFLGPQPPAADPGPIYFFTAPGPNYFFTPPNDGITFSRPPTSKITFSRPLVITIVWHVFFYSFKQNSTYSLFKNSFQQNVLSYTNQLQCKSIGCFFI